MKVPLSNFDKLFSNLASLYFYEDIIDFKKIEERFKNFILKKFPILSSVIKKEENTENKYYFESVSPCNVTFTQKIIEEKLEKTLFENFQPEQKYGVLSHDEGKEFYKYFESIETKLNIMEPVLNKPVMKVTLLELPKLKKSILCISITHAIVDAHSLTYLMNIWSENEEMMKNFKDFNLSRKLLESNPKEFDESKADKEILKRSELYHPNKSPKLEKDKIGFNILPSPCILKVIKFSKDRIQELKKSINLPKGTKFSTNDCITAHLWKLHCAINHKEDMNALIPLYLIVNFRNRMNGIKENYMGNGAIAINTKMMKKDVLESNYTTLVKKIRELIERVDEKQVKLIVNLFDKYYKDSMNLWTKNALVVDDWRIFDKLKPDFIQKGETTKKSKCRRVVFNPLQVQNYVPQMWFVNLDYKDKEMKTINISAYFSKENFEKIKSYDLSDPKVIEEIVKLK